MSVFEDGLVLMVPVLVAIDVNPARLLAVPPKETQPEASMPSAPRYRRVLLKLSGEGLMGERESGLDPAMVTMVAQEVKAVHEMGVQVCLVIGGGNMFRGVSGAAAGMDRASGDYMGMLATVINSLAMQSALERQGLPIVDHVLKTPKAPAADTAAAYRAMFDAIPEGLTCMLLHCNAPGDIETIAPDHAALRTAEYALFHRRSSLTGRTDRRLRP